MDLMHYAEQMRYGELHVCYDEKTGLKAIVALHNLKLGPAIGGCRCIEYPNSDDALRDVMRLARGMTYKAAISKLPHGGGKSVIMRPPRLPHGSPERRALFEAFGEFVNSLGGRYLPAEDSGTTIEDMNVMRTRTDYCLGSEAGSGDPSPFTAYGVRRGIEAAVKFRYGRDSLEGLHVAIQGLGHVGYYLAKELHALGARLTVTDVRAESVARAVEEFGARSVSVDAIYEVDADIFAPCALGAVLNDQTIPWLKVDIVAGAANNQLAEDHHGQALLERNILYAPDYAINAGGLINVASEAEGYDAQKSRDKTTEIYQTMMSIFERSAGERLPTNVVADRIVEEIIYA
jgi:leucine dehydrogenase